ncbi:MAG: DNA polymerase III subunit beta, partial [Myxococcota bacterium]
EGRLSVSATDLDVGISGTYSADVKIPGAVAVHARQLFDIVKSLPGDEISIERQDNFWLELTSGKSRFRLVGMAPDEFPALPAYGQVKTFRLPAALLTEMIDQTIFCVSTDDNRHNLSGVFCTRPSEKMLRMVSTDGHRLAMSERTLETVIPLTEGVIVPRKGFQELRRVLADTSEKLDEVELGFSQNAGLLRAGAVTLTTRLVEGQFPDYEQVIPREATKRARIPRAPLAEALKRVSLLSQARGHGVRLTLSQGKVELVAEDPEHGEARETLDVSYEGEGLTVGFNARYLLDVLGLVHDNDILLELTDDLSPGVVKPGDKPGFLAVVMPMRI